MNQTKPNTYRHLPKIWKIGIGFLVLLFGLIFMSLDFMQSIKQGMMPAYKDIPPLAASANPVSTQPQEMIESAQPSPHNVDSLLNEMEFATLVFNTPTNINIDDSPRIQLILSLSETVNEIKHLIVEEGKRIGTTIRVSDRMEARLSGPMFQITAITSEIQAVSKNQRTEWQWEIYPKKDGKHNLYLTLTALLEIDGYNTPRSIKTFSKIIKVNVTTSQKAIMFFKNNWQWLWAAILVPVIGWLWKRRKSS